MNGPHHIAIVGGSGSGKTWLAEQLAAALGPRAGRVSLDDFYRDLSALPAAERDAVNFDDPAAIDWDAVRLACDTLQTGRAAELPLYDFATHTRRRETRRFGPVPLVIWDGLWLLHPEWLRGRFVHRIFVACPAEVRYQRRAERDCRERGRSPESVRRQFQEHVEPMHRRFVEPQQAAATRVLASPPAAQELEYLRLELQSITGNL